PLAEPRAARVCAVAQAPRRGVHQGALERREAGGRAVNARRREGQLRLPLPEALRHLLEGQRPDDGDNLGLWLDKLVRVDDETWKLEADARERELDRLFCPRERNVPRAWQSDAARHAVTRLREACADVHGE